MPGLVPGIHVLGGNKGVDGRVKPGHDGENTGYFTADNDITDPC
jgi:hypothetical protein